jgi:hypothetical protein
VPDNVRQELAASLGAAPDRGTSATLSTPDPHRVQLVSMSPPVGAPNGQTRRWHSLLSGATGELGRTKGDSHPPAAYLRGEG